MLLKNEFGNTGMPSISMISYSSYFPNYTHLLNMRNFPPFCLHRGCVSISIIYCSVCESLCKIEYAFLLPLVGSSLSCSTTTGKNIIFSV